MRSSSKGGAWLRREADGLWEPDKRAAALRKIIRERMDSAPKMLRGAAVSGVETLMRYGALTDFEGGWDTDSNPGRIAKAVKYSTSNPGLMPVPAPGMTKSPSDWERYRRRERLSAGCNSWSKAFLKTAR